MYLSPQARMRSGRLSRALWRGLAGAGRWRSQLVATAEVDPDTWRPWHGGAEWTAADYLWSPVPVQEVRRNDVPAILACGPTFEVEFEYVVRDGDRAQAVAHTDCVRGRFIARIPSQRGQRRRHPQERAVVLCAAPGAEIHLLEQLSLATQFHSTSREQPDTYEPMQAVIQKEI